MLTFKQLIGVFVLVLGLAYILPGYRHTIRPPASQLNLQGYQTAEGLIATFKFGTSADPYFGLYTLELAQRAGLDVKRAREKFIRWGLRAQKADGRFDRYCKVGKQWQPCGRTDSDDATLARWVLLLHQAAPGDLPTAWQDSADRAEAQLLALQMPNGIFSVFPEGTPGYQGYALFKDNVEVLSVLEELTRVQRAKGQDESAQRYGQLAAQLRTHMGEVFGEDPFKMKRLALPTDYDQWRFYPHGAAAPVGWLEGYFTAPTADQWQAWLAQTRSAWEAQAKTDFPWGLVALSALRSGQKPVAAEWLLRAAPLRAQGAHWNVLEEASFQIVTASGLNTAR